MVVGVIIKQWFYVIFGLAFVALSVAGWPNVIVVDEAGLTSTQLLRRQKRIHWPDLKCAQYNVNNHLTELVSMDGTKIYHTGFHRDPGTLHELINEHARVKVRRIEPTWTGHREVE